MEELSAHRAQCIGPTIEDEEGRLRARIAALEAECAQVREMYGVAAAQRDDFSREIQHLRQGKAALEQHVSDLEKSLENARKERDAVRDVATTRISLLEDMLAEMEKEISRWMESVETVKAERDTERRLRLEQAEEHRKALVRARNEGLEMAAVFMGAEEEKHRAAKRKMDLATKAGHHGFILAEERETVCGVAADDIRAMMEPEPH